IPMLEHQLPRARGVAGAVANVRDARVRLVDRAQPTLAHPEREIGVLEVARRVRLVEPAKLEEALPAHEQAGSRRKIDLAAKADLEVVGTRSGADRMRMAERVHDRAGFLH